MEQPELRAFRNGEKDQPYFFSIHGDQDPEEGQDGFEPKPKKHQLRFIPLYDEKNNQIIIAHVWTKPIGTKGKREEIVKVLEDYFAVRLKMQTKDLDEHAKAAGFSNMQLFYFAREPHRKTHVESPTPISRKMLIQEGYRINGSFLAGFLRSAISAGDFMTFNRHRLSRFTVLDTDPAPVTEDPDQKWMDVRAWLLKGQRVWFKKNEKLQDLTYRVNRIVPEAYPKAYMSDKIAFAIRNREEEHGGAEMEVAVIESGGHLEGQIKRKDLDTVISLERLIKPFVGEQIPKISHLTFHLDSSIVRSHQGKDEQVPHTEPAAYESKLKESNFVSEAQEERIRAVLKDYGTEGLEDVSDDDRAKRIEARRKSLKSFLMLLQRRANTLTANYNEPKRIFKLPERMTYSVFEAPYLYGHKRIVVEFERDPETGRYMLLQTNTEKPIGQVGLSKALTSQYAIKLLPPFKPMKQRLEDANKVESKLPWMVLSESQFEFLIPQDTRASRAELRTLQLDATELQNKIKILKLELDLKKLFILPTAALFLMIAVLFIDSLSILGRSSFAPQILAYAAAATIMFAGMIGIGGYLYASILKKQNDIRFSELKLVLPRPSKDTLQDLPLNRKSIRTPSEPSNVLVYASLSIPAISLLSVIYKFFSYETFPWHSFAVFAMVSSFVLAAVIGNKRNHPRSELRSDPTDPSTARRLPFTAKSELRGKNIDVETGRAETRQYSQLDEVINFFEAGYWISFGYWTSPDLNGVPHGVRISVRNVDPQKFRAGKSEGGFEVSDLASDGPLMLDMIYPWLPEGKKLGRTFISLALLFLAEHELVKATGKNRRFRIHATSSQLAKSLKSLPEEWQIVPTPAGEEDRMTVSGTIPLIPSSNLEKLKTLNELNQRAELRAKEESEWTLDRFYALFDQTFRLSDLEIDDLIDRTEKMLPTIAKQEDIDKLRRARARGLLAVVKVRLEGGAVEKKWFQMAGSDAQTLNDTALLKQVEVIDQHIQRIIRDEISPPSIRTRPRAELRSKPVEVVSEVRGQEPSFEVGEQFEVRVQGDKRFLIPSKWRKKLKL
ncbi:MAG: hypothetical protein HY515_00625, partial [Candidatus Aenigmarchaeota archaeon]|nr:hypothetical protein [Candidatus Aenigmarchaeota archaeon]